MLRKQDARRATNKTGNTNSAQRCVTGPVDDVAARNRKDGYAKVDQRVIATNPLTTTNTNSPSSPCFHSTYSSASGESEVPSPAEEWRARRQNQQSVLVTKGDDVELELQQLAPAPTQEKMKTNTVPLITYLRSSTVSILSDASLPAEANEEAVAIHPTIEVEMHKGDWSSVALPVPSRARPETTATSNESQYSKQTEIRTITAEDLLTTGSNCLVLAASSTLFGVADASQADDSEANPILCPTATKGDEGGIQVFIAPQSGLNNVVVGSDRLLTDTQIANDNALDANVIPCCQLERKRNVWK